MYRYTLFYTPLNKNTKEQKNKYPRDFYFCLLGAISCMFFYVYGFFFL